jgi:NifB/MoaA-like Fe-S oxidoreductase
VSVIPVGLTKHRENLPYIRPFDRETAAAALEDVEEFGRQCLEKHGSRIFFPSDELYLKAGRDIPEEEFYEEYPQLENGVGLLRLCIEDFRGELNSKYAPKRCSHKPFTIATGTAAAPFIAGLLEEARSKYRRLNGTVRAIENDFFGRMVDVAGLVTGGDLINQLRGQDLGSVLIIPNRMLRAGEDVFLDDVTVGDVSRELDIEVRPIAADGASLFSAMINA